MKKKGYLFVLPWDIHNLGGVNQVVSNLIDNLKKNEIFYPILLINSWNNFFLKEENKFNQQYFKFRLRSLYSKKQFILNILKYLVFILYDLGVLIFFINKKRIFTINIHYPELPALHFVLLKFLRLFKGKIILSFHGSDIRDISNTKKFEKKLWEFIFHYSDSIVCCSNNLGSRVIKHFPKIKNKIKIIHNGIDQKKFLLTANYTETPQHINVHIPYILSVGAFRHIKGHDILLKAYKNLYSLNNEYSLIIIGNKFNSFKKIKKYIAENNLEEKIFLITDLPHKKIADYYKNASLFILPSRMEALGIVLLEAGLFKLPVIACNVGGIPEIINDNDTGLLFQLENHRELSQKIIRLIKNHDYAKKIGNNLYNKVVNEFTWKNAIKKYLNIMSF